MCVDRSRCWKHCLSSQLSAGKSATCTIQFEWSVELNDRESHCRLRSATSNQLDVRPSRLVTVGDRSFGSPWWHYIGFIAETVHLALLGQSSGTVSLMTLHRPHCCQFSERNWKLNYFSNLIRTLFCSLLWFFVAIVVLEVIFVT